MPTASIARGQHVQKVPFTNGDVLFLGNIGAELSDSDISMFVSSDAGNTWRQVRKYSGSSCQSLNDIKMAHSELNWIQFWELTLLHIITYLTTYKS